MKNILLTSRLATLGLLVSGNFFFYLQGCKQRNFNSGENDTESSTASTFPSQNGSAQNSASQKKMDDGIPLAGLVGEEIQGNFEFVFGTHTGIAKNIGSSWPQLVNVSAATPAFSATFTTDKDTEATLSKPQLCNNAARFLGGQSLVADDQKKCLLQISKVGNFGNGGNAVSIVFIPVDQNGKGFASGPLPGVALSAEKTTSTFSSPQRPNQQLDVDAAGKDFERVHDLGDRSSVLSFQVLGCLMNTRARNWTEIAAHYYCQLPFEMRECYSDQLIKTRPQSAAELNAGLFPSVWDAAKFIPKSKSELGGAIAANSAAHKAAWQFCKSKEIPDAKFYSAELEAGFQKYVTTFAGIADYNLEQEQQVINNFYGSVYRTGRIRRAFDSYPDWSAAQPRYDALRKFQEANAALLK